MNVGWDHRPVRFARDFGPKLHNCTNTSPTEANLNEINNAFEDSCRIVRVFHVLARSVICSLGCR